MTDKSANWTLSDEEDELSNDDEKGSSSRRKFDQGLSQESVISDCDDEDSGDGGGGRKRVRFVLGEDDACDEEESEEELEDEELDKEEGLEKDEKPDTQKESKSAVKPIAYVSPHRRRDNDIRTMKLEQLMRRVQGLVNRLDSGTIIIM